MIIYKYPIELHGSSTIDLEDSDVVLDAAIQHYRGVYADYGVRLYIWVLKKLGNGVVKPRTFRVYFTGEELAPNASRRYIKTIHHNGLVYHLFEE